MGFFAAHRDDLVSLGGFLAASFGAAALGGLATGRSVNTWYRTLRKPALTPPDGVFGPVWTILYAQMAVSAWLTRRTALRHPARAASAEPALATWAGQLGLNLAWSVVFFGLRRIGAGLLVIVPLWGAIAACAALSARVSRPAGLLLLPYLAWTSFATYLNAQLWRLNRGR